MNSFPSTQSRLSSSALFIIRLSLKALHDQFVIMRRMQIKNWFAKIEQKITSKFDKRLAQMYFDFKNIDFI